MKDYLIQLGSILTKRQRLGAILLGGILFFAMLLEVFSLGILLPLLTLIIDPKKINQNHLIEDVKLLFDNITDKEFVIYFLLAFWGFIC